MEGENNISSRSQKFRKRRKGLKQKIAYKFPKDSRSLGAEIGVKKLPEYPHLFSTLSILLGTQKKLEEIFIFRKTEASLKNNKGQSLFFHRLGKCP